MHSSEQDVYSIYYLPCVSSVDAGMSVTILHAWTHEPTKLKGLSLDDLAIYTYIQVAHVVSLCFMCPAPHFAVAVTTRVLHAYACNSKSCARHRPGHACTDTFPANTAACTVYVLRTVRGATTSQLITAGSYAYRAACMHARAHQCRYSLRVGLLGFGASGSTITCSTVNNNYY